MRKAAHVIAANNVVPFPVRAAAAPIKAIRRGRKPKCTNVLKFTGKKIDNYDCNARRSDWQEGLLEQMAMMYARAVKGEFSGLMIIGSRGVPKNGSGPNGLSYSLSGIFCTDFSLAARYAEAMGVEAEKLAVERPARPV